MGTLKPRNKVYCGMTEQCGRRDEMREWEGFNLVGYSGFKASICPRLYARRYDWSETKGCCAVFLVDLIIPPTLPVLEPPQRSRRSRRNEGHLQYYT